MSTYTRSQLRMAGLLVLHVLCGVAILGLLIMYVPEQEKIFKDFGLRLPAMTVFVLSLSRFVGNYSYIVVPCLGMVDIAVLSRLNRAGKLDQLSIWGILIWLAEMLLMGPIIAAVMLPMNDLMLRLSK